jgi:hypothetical protein
MRRARQEVELEEKKGLKTRKDGNDRKQRIRQRKQEQKGNEFIRSRKEKTAKANGMCV